jgi:hypothetical protein
MVDILREKRASNKIIDDIMIDARRLSSEALEMMSQANKKSAKAEECTINERKCASAQLHKKCTHISSESARLRQKLVTTIKKVDREHESPINLFKLKSNKKYDKARSEHESSINLFKVKSDKKYDKARSEHESSINLFRLKSDKKYDKARSEHESSINLFRLKSDKKYDKARSDVVTISTKLKEQRFIWYTRLCDIDSSSKSLVSKERARRRYAVQQQLDRTSAMESQLQEIVEGLGIMNYELVDEVKNANTAKRTTIKLYDKSKESASRCFEQLQIEKEEKNRCRLRKKRRINLRMSSLVF